jgi:hypothetical protein
MKGIFKKEELKHNWATYVCRGRWGNSAHLKENGITVIVS